MGKQAISVPVSEVASYKQLPFAVHVDEDNQQVQHNLRSESSVPLYQSW